MRESNPSPCSMFRMEYEIGDTGVSMWTAHVGAFSHQEAINHLVKTIGKPLKVNVSGMQCRLDDLSTAIRKNIIVQQDLKKKSPINASCFRIEYEMGEQGNNWVAFIGAYSHDEAISHLVNTLGKTIRVNVTGMQCKIDDISDELRGNVIMRWNMSKPTKSEAELLKKNSNLKDVETVEEDIVGMKQNESNLQETVIEDEIEKKKKRLLFKK
jgi:hypothetical protein